MLNAERERERKQAPSEKSAEEKRREATDRRSGARLKAQSMARERAAARRDLANAETKKLRVNQFKEKKKRYGTPGAPKLDALTDHEREVVGRYNERLKGIDAEKKQLDRDVQRRQKEIRAGKAKAKAKGKPAAGPSARARGVSFIAKSSFDGHQPGYVFKTGSMGLGYYLDTGCMPTRSMLPSPTRPAASAGGSLFQWRDPTKNVKQTFAADIITKSGGRNGRAAKDCEDEVEVQFVTDPDGTVRMVQTGDPEFADPD
jgi:hypothetical protein